MKLLETLINDYTLSPQVADFLGNNLILNHFTKDTLLLSKGQICDCIYFLETGTARGFYDQNNREYTSWFVQEGDFIYSPYSFLKQKPSLESVQLLEDSIVIAIPLVALNYIYETYPETNQIGRLITEQYLLLYDQRAYNLRYQTSEQRLHGFIETYPTVFDKAQKKHIASYLGIAPGTLSRLLSAKQKCSYID